jgi:hypothetical protein
MAVTDQQLAERHQLSVEQVRRLRELRGTSNETLAGLASSAIPKALRKLDQPNAAEARARHQALFVRGDEGRAPPRAALSRAIAQTAKMREADAAPPRRGGALERAGRAGRAGRAPVGAPVGAQVGAPHAALAAAA